MPIYQIRIREEIDDDFAARFSPLTITHEPNGATTFTKPVRNQAELHGLLGKIRDLNLTLLSLMIWSRAETPKDQSDHQAVNSPDVQCVCEIEGVG